ncbi:MAG: DUF1015 domain-containing protein [Phycisphaerae bacterium]|nr:DUF1015 domain-containing protein [Phycisphaerae bacterium]
MAEIQPLKGIRYTPKSGTDIGPRLAPPYDVLSDADKRALLQRDPANFVKIDLPHTPPKFAGPPEAYAAAKTTLDEWLKAGVMKQDAQPAIYVYHQAYTHAGRKYLRKKFFVRLRLEEFGKGSVYPHEQTFGGPKEDRLLLTQATACNLSPIFGLFEDPSNAVSALLDRAIASLSPILTGDAEGVSNTVWAVTDSATIAAVQAAMRDKAIYIADGHHRYGTGLNYRARLQEKGGPLAADHPANYVLCVCCPMSDAGLLILPTHRVMPGLAITETALIGESSIQVAPLNAPSADAALEAVAAMGPQAFVFVRADGKMFSVKPRDPALLDSLEPNHSAAWRRLALAFLHAYVIDRVLTPKVCAGKPPEIHYVKNVAEAVGEAKETKGCVFLMQPNTMEELRQVCLAGDLMPQKSTFFFPKLASGLVVNPLA